MKNILKQGLYLFSMFLLLFLVFVVYVQSLTDSSALLLLPEVMGKLPLSMLMFFGSLALICLLMLLHRLLLKLPLKNHRLLILTASAAAVILQISLLLTLKPVLRYDHLKVFDEALGVLRTGELSLTAHDGYFGYYPFNIPITLFHAGLLRIFLFFGIKEAALMSALQCFYALFIDSAVAASYFIIRKLRSERTALLFVLLCLCNPILYVCASGCYTTTLMIPLLMWNLFLIVFFLAEKHPRRKLLLGLLLGIALVFGVKIRATILITIIAFAGYCIVHVRNVHTFFQNRKQAVISAAAIVLGGLLCYGGLIAIENTYVKGDYHETQLPPSYYFMFAANPDSLGHYDEADFEMMIQYKTLDEKNEASMRILSERLKSFGPSGILKLAGHKLSNTWADGTEDYADFLVNSRNYGTLHSLIAGNRSDFFALYCHMYHLAVLAMLAVCIIVFLRKKQCNTSYYIVLLNLLGGMLFHILWESYVVYSISFSLLAIIAASEGLTVLSEQKAFQKRTVLPFALAGTAVAAVLVFIPYGSRLFHTQTQQQEMVLMQDMYDGNDVLPLLSGETVTQTFSADKSFNQIAVKVLNENREENLSLYKLSLLDGDGNTLSEKTFHGCDVWNKDYCYLKFPSVIPDGKTVYQIVITALDADESQHLTFPYYHTGNYDIYSDGKMSGLNSDEKSDLNFIVFDEVTKAFLN